MKTDLEQQDIEAIAERVIELLRPVLSGNGNNEDKDMIFNKAELAEYLRTSVSTISKLVSNNEIPFFKIASGQSGGVRFNKKDIDKWTVKRSVPEVNQYSLKR